MIQTALCAIKIMISVYFVVITQIIMMENAYQDATTPIVTLATLTTIPTADCAKKDMELEKQKKTYMISCLEKWKTATFVINISNSVVLVILDIKFRLILKHVKNEKIQIALIAQNQYN